VNRSDLIERIGALLVYNPKEPILFNSGLFLALFTVFSIIYAIGHRYILFRLWFTTLFSLYFYYKSSGEMVVLFMASIIFNHQFSLIIFTSLNKNNYRAARFWLTMSIIGNLIPLLYYKYAQFLVDNLGYVLGIKAQIKTILPAGISFFTFQAISYCVDVFRGGIAPARSLLDFAFYLSFFPHMLAGPIQRAADFLYQIRQQIVLTHEQISSATYLILKGLFKKAVIADYVAQYCDIVYENPAGYSGFENLMAMYGYALQIYCDFSGYTDMAIGIALLMGYQLSENFKSPYVSLSITEFWRRWHITLSSWLRDYIYIPLGGNRYGKFNQYRNLLITMLIGGFWHGASWKFVFWGGMHGLGLAIHKFWLELKYEFTVGKYKIKTANHELDHFFWKNALRFISWLLTFHFVAILWVYFRAPSFELATISLTQIFTAMDWEYIVPFWQARKIFVLLLCVGFGFHLLRTSFKEKIRYSYQKASFAGQFIIWVIVIQLWIHLQNENVQPFIYFQF
jgi:D-alanyl-lipoteichoic acid acyltransferase DltB (MBOAT superfamily)